MCNGTSGIIQNNMLGCTITLYYRAHEIWNGGKNYNMIITFQNKCVMHCSYEVNIY